MSDTEFHTGKLKKIEKPRQISFEDFCRQICSENGKATLNSYNDTWVEQLRDDLSNKYFCNSEKETIYEFINHATHDPGNSFVKLYDEPDGTISFICSFYNGGTCLEEMLEESFEKRESGS